MRPVVRLDRRAHGQRRVDGGDHPRGDPASRAQHRRRERQPHPHRRAARHQRRRRGRPRHRLQRAGAARSRQCRRTEARLHHPARERLGREPRPQDRPAVHGDARPVAGRRLPPARGADGERVPQARLRPAQGQEHVRAGDALQPVRPRHGPRPRPDRVHLRQEGRQGHQVERGAARGRLRVGGAQPRVRLPRAGGSRHRAAACDQRQHRDGARRARLGYGHLRHVPDHAGHLGLALPERRVRARRGASSTRRRTRSRPAPSRSAPRTRARSR